jgi:ABC-type sugar transport system ATPase subunit
VHKRLVAQRDAGMAVLLVSSELDEIYALADRIAVMYEGQIVAFCPPTISEQELGLLMAGSDPTGSTAPDGEPGTSDGEPETPAQAQEPSSHE